ncbi:MAG: DNA polymerase III subunit delta' [Thiocapsa sp.]|uniref:DNA polymerase III subunit delta' n=1 Tax=Thiocapsa sp. TaxID=2024551 RepID=UPI001BCF0064|nr:DNA polymerase III subunit delta' [Thiocapsa sp.]QVL49388.1 MAG: DNA polymerase III subunit delta' [Thiocapsa sp.]
MTEPTPLAFDAALPWLAEDWMRLNQARRDGRLAHGLLFSGPRGIGKRHLVELLARSMLCGTPTADGLACGRCADCALIAAASHPDLLRVGPDPEAKSEEIPVAAIRALVERGALTPSRAAWKVTLVDPADHLNAAAANALLKTLEEPPGSALIVLVTEQPGRLPATIRSRCGQIRIPTPSTADALAWLAGRIPRETAALRLCLAHGGPLRAVDELDDARLEQRRERIAGFLAIARGERDPLAEASAWNGLGPRLCLDWLSGWLVDLVRLAVSEHPTRLDNPDQREALRTLARRLEPASLHRLLQRVLRARALVETRANPQLLLESLSIEWLRVGAGQALRRS